MSLCVRILLPLLFVTHTVFAQPVKSAETNLLLQFDTGNPAPYGMASTVITIKGKSFPIIVDTGAKKYGLALTKEALQKIHVQFTGKLICSNSVTGTHCEKEFIVPEVKLGGFIIKNVGGVLVERFWGGLQGDDGFKSTEASHNGLLGYALLSKFNILLDYKNSKLTLIKPGNTPAQYDVARWQSIPFDNHLHTKLNADKKTLIFSWDTGALPSVISRKAASTLKQTRCPTDNPYKESKDNCFRVEITSLTTMNNELVSNNTWFSLTDIPDNAPFDGLIGSNFYANNLVYFDFDNHKIHVKPVSI